MEFLEGETLADRLRKGPLPLQQVLKYGIEIDQSLEIAHRTGVVHRDLKPGNIMLTKSGAKLMDFGLAKATPPIAPSSSGLSMTQPTPVSAHPLTMYRNVPTIVPCVALVPQTQRREAPKSSVAMSAVASVKGSIPFCRRPDPRRWPAWSWGQCRSAPLRPLRLGRR
jgi:serine/threonine protein kinase